MKNYCNIIENKVFNKFPYIAAVFNMTLVGFLWMDKGHISIYTSIRDSENINDFISLICNVFIL